MVNETVNPLRDFRGKFLRKAELMRVSRHPAHP